MNSTGNSQSHSTGSAGFLETEYSITDMNTQSFTFKEASRCSLKRLVQSAHYLGSDR